LKIALGVHQFGLASATAGLSFIVSFGLVKALANLSAGQLSDRLGRKGVLIVGWLVALPIPLLLILAPSWGWIVAANVLLGLNQGLCWSTTVIMKIDLVGPARRGLAMGLNEAAGYGAVALAAVGSGYLASVYGLRPWPFLPGVVLALAGLLVSTLWVRESHSFARHEAQVLADTQRGVRGLFPPPMPNTSLSFITVLRQVSWHDRTLSAVSQAGLINNLNDGLAWGLFPFFFAAGGLSLAQIGLLVGLYPGVWGTAQLATGALSDRIGRKPLIVGGMWLQAAALGLLPLTHGVALWAGAMVLLGLGTALVYPTFLAAVADVAPPSWRASAVGVYRLWRDSGYAVGALLAGLLADRFGVLWAIACIAALTFASGTIVLVRMRETMQRRLRPAVSTTPQSPNVTTCVRSDWRKDIGG
jgi:MFS family permease